MFWTVYSFNKGLEEFELVFVSSIKQESVDYYNRIKLEDVDKTNHEKRSICEPFQQDITCLKNQLVKERLGVMTDSLNKIVSMVEGTIK